jgi:preprotein translocase subunit SecG
MGILRSLLIIIEVLSSFLLVAVILIQKTKSEGLGLAFGSGMGETLFGSRAGNVLTKATIGLAVIFLGNTLLLAILSAGAHERALMAEETAGARVPAPATATTRPASEPASMPPGLAPTLPGAFPSDQAAPAAAAPTAPAGTPTLPGVRFDDEAPAPVESPSDQPESSP